MHAALPACCGMRTTYFRRPPSRVTRHGGVRRRWTGKQVFSLLLPTGLYVGDGTPDALHDRDRPVLVRDGALVCGALRKAHVGTGAGGIVDVMARELGGVECMRFMGDSQRLTNAFLLQHGHAVGIDDVMLTAEGPRRRAPVQGGAPVRGDTA